MIRMLLVGYCFGIRSERRLCEEVHLNLAYRWFCRLGPGRTSPDHSTFSKNRHGRFRESDLLRHVFEAVVRRCIAEGLVGGEQLRGRCEPDQGGREPPEANRPRDEVGPAPIDPTRRRAVREYLAVLDDAAFGAASDAEPKFTSPADPAAQWTGARRAAFFAYATNYLVDTDNAIIVDVEATRAIRQAEVGAARTMIDRTTDRFGLSPERLIARHRLRLGADAGLAGRRARHRAAHPGLRQVGPKRRDARARRLAYDRQTDVYVCPALSLDASIRTALINSEVVRVLAGVTAISSGQTIYDAAITNTTIDQERARFDPTVSVTNSWDRTETPIADFDPLDPTRTIIDGIRVDDYDMQFDLTKTTATGGEFNFGVSDLTRRRQPGVFPLDPENRTSLDLSYTQPLLQGGGVAANLVPIVLARIDTERSYFQFKDSVQDMVRSVIEAYWTLVFARTDLWAREQQVVQAEFAYRQAEAGARFDRISGAEAAPVATRIGQLSRRAGGREGQCASAGSGTAKHSRTTAARSGADYADFATVERSVTGRLEFSRKPCRGVSARHY